MLVNIQIPTHIGDEVVLWSNKIIVTKDDLEDWEYINFIYPLLVGQEKIGIISRIVSTNSRIKTELRYHNMILLQLRSELNKKSEDLYWKTVIFFDPEEFRKALKKYRIKSSIFEDKIVLEFNNIKIGNDEEGYIIYTKILLFLKDWKIDGFMFKFKNFDYSSYWNLDIILHPYLEVPLGFNEVLTWLPANEYNIYVQSLVEMVTQYMPTSGRDATLKNTITRFNKYRKLWNTLRYDYKTRLELSQAIFKGE